MAKGLAGSAKIFADGLTDPLFIVGKIFDTYLEINKASVDAQRLTGQNAVTAASWNTGLATAKDYLETISELTKQTGMNAQNVFSKDVIAQAAELKTVMGLTAEEAGGIALMAQTSNKSVRDVTDSVVATTSAFNKANRAAVSQGQVLRDVANTSQSIKLSLGNNDVAIAKAATAAARLGMNLERVDQIASSLTNFEDSIGKELEAELLIGKELNLEKARELALNNDLAGLSEELFKNSADINEFGKMNRIQQEAYAASLGMTRDELAKIAYTQALANGMTEEQAAAAAKVNAEDMKRVAAQENFANALAKIAGALAPMLDIVGSILNLPLAPYFILAAAAATKLGFSVSGIGKAFGSMFSAGKQAVTGLLGLFKKGGLSSALGGLKDKLTGGFKEGLADKAQELGGKASEASDKSKGIGKGAGEGVKDFLTNLGKGLTAFGEAMMGPGALGLLALVGTVYAVGKALEVAAPGIEAFGKAIKSAFEGIATIITAVANGFVNIMKAVSMDNIGPMLLLGPALFGIAAGLGAVGAAGIMSLPGLGALAIVSKIAPSIVSAGGKTAGSAKGKAEEGSMTAVAQKLDVLIELARKGTVVMLDGKVLATSNSQNQKQVLSNQR